MMKIYFAVPTHNNTLTVETAVTMLNLSMKGPEERVQFHFVFHSASIISHLRNTIIADFLAGDFTHVFMLDSDQGFDYSTFFRMLRSDYSVVGILYPRRNFDWSQFNPVKPVNSINDVLSQGIRFVGDVKLDAAGTIKIENGFTQAVNVGTGALLIKRETILRMMAHYPELQGQGFPDEDENLPRQDYNWGFFNPMVKAADGMNAGEDIGFCKRWSDCGGKIWAEVMTDSIHVGRYKFSGNYVSHLKSIGVLG